MIYALTDDASVYANVSRLYEPPTNFELADDVQGNNHVLDPMHGTVVEIGTRGRGDLGARNSWGWEVDVYQAWIQDEILSVDDPNAPGTSLSTNVDQTIHAGIEALVDFRFALDDSGTHTIAPLVSISLNDFSFDNDDVYGSNQLPAAPDYVVRGEVLYRNSNGLFAGPTFDMVGERYADFVNSYTVDSLQPARIPRGMGQGHLARVRGIPQRAGRELHRDDRRTRRGCARRGNSQPRHAARGIRRRSGAAMTRRADARAHASAIQPRQAMPT